MKGRKIPIDSSDFIHSKHALVGVFDFLGFKQIMASEDLLDVGAQVKRISGWVKGSGEAKTQFEFEGKRSTAAPKVIQISDTFVVYTLTREPQEVLQFLWNVHHMLFYSIYEGLPLRGALSTGEILVSKDTRLFFGPAILEALEFEKDQEWAGGCITPSLESYIKEIGLQEVVFPLVLPYEVPVKCKKARTQAKFAINWVADPFHYIAPNWVHKHFRPAPEGSREEGSVHEKIENTQRFLEFAVQQTLENRSIHEPVNRRIILEPSDVPGYRTVRVALVDDDVNDNSKSSNPTHS